MSWSAAKKNRRKSIQNRHPNRMLSVLKVTLESHDSNRAFWIARFPIQNRRFSATKGWTLLLSLKGKRHDNALCCKRSLELGSPPPPFTGYKIYPQIEINRPKSIEKNTKSPPPTSPPRPKKGKKMTEKGRKLQFPSNLHPFAVNFPCFLGAGRFPVILGRFSVWGYFVPCKGRRRFQASSSQRRGCGGGASMCSHGERGSQKWRPLLERHPVACGAERPGGPMCPLGSDYEECTPAIVVVHDIPDQPLAPRGPGFFCHLDRFCQRINSCALDEKSRLKAANLG